MRKEALMKTKSAAKRLAEVRARATEVLGSPEAAEAWLKSPALALDGQTPVEMLKTQEGLETVQTLLTRLDYGVYT
jgi:putative toxin-antitoxin system antitoxin component (TIGR02293 family)